MQPVTFITHYFIYGEVLELVLKGLTRCEILAVMGRRLSTRLNRALSSRERLALESFCRDVKNEYMRFVFSPR